VIFAESLTLDGGVITTIVGAFVTIIVAFLGVAKIMLNASVKERESATVERREERDAFLKSVGELGDVIKDVPILSADQVKSNQYVAKALVLRVESDKNMAKMLERVAKAQERTADEAKERNGHLAQISIQNKDAILEAIKSIMVTQSVVEQSVEHQTIKSKE